MENYERSNAREWDLEYKENQKPQAADTTWQVVSSHRKPETDKQKQSASPQKWHDAGGGNKDGRRNRRQPPPKLMQQTDNDAAQLWREHGKPRATIRIPEHFVLGNQAHEDIARRNNTFILCDNPTGSHPTGGHQSLTFGIWGELEAVTATKQQLNQWMEDCAPSRQSQHHSTKFAKLASLTPELRLRAERSWNREVKRQKFRQFPPPHIAFGAIGSFHWPVNEYRPEEVLGKSYEAFDPIRMDCRCYVVFDKLKSVFQVMGTADNVKAALDRIKNTCFQIAARQVNPVRLYLLYWPDAPNVPSHVSLLAYAQVKVLSGHQATTERKGKALRGEGTADDEDSRLEARIALSEERLRSSMLKLMPKLHYYCGNIHMRVRLGTFIAKQYIDKKDKDGNSGPYELEEYERMIAQSQFEGCVTQELGDKGREVAALGALQDAADLLVPQDAMTMHLADIKPVYSAIFIFADETSDLRLSMSWQEAQDPDTTKAAFDLISKKWARLERENSDVGSPSAPTPLLDVSLTDLNTGMAWQFDIEAAQGVEESRLPRPFTEFAHGVVIDANAILKGSDDKPFVIYKSYGVIIKSIQQRTSHRYGLSSSDYTLELTRCQDRMYPPRKSAFMPAGEPTVYEPRWSLSVYRIAWDTMFTKNERLPIGEIANWEHDVETWFPEDLTASPGPEGQKPQGFGQLLEKLKAISKLLKGTTSEDDLTGGMTVG